VTTVAEAPAAQVTEVPGVQVTEATAVQVTEATAVQVTEATAVQVTEARRRGTTTPAGGRRPPIWAGVASIRVGSTTSRSTTTAVG
jgi:hypothetical protein